MLFAKTVKVYFSHSVWLNLPKEFFVSSMRSDLRAHVNNNKKDKKKKISTAYSILFIYFFILTKKNNNNKKNYLLLLKHNIY